MRELVINVFLWLAGALVWLSILATAEHEPGSTRLTEKQQLSPEPCGKSSVPRAGGRVVTQQTTTLPYDYARCNGRQDDGKWREGCEDCMRRTSPGRDHW